MRCSLTFLAMLAAPIVLSSDRTASAEDPVVQPPAAPDASSRDRAIEAERELSHQIEIETPSREKRASQIEAEIAELRQAETDQSGWAKEWAGSYYVGDGTGMNVTILIAPKAGVTYTWRGCLGLYDANHGDIVESFPGGVRVKLAIDPARSRYRFMDSTLYFVRWGDRRYLVPESQMDELVSNYNEGSYARNSLYSAPRKFTNDARPHGFGLEPTPAGVPELPPQYARQLILKRTELSVTEAITLDSRAVGEHLQQKRWKLECKGGSAEGIYVGMVIAYPPNSGLGRFVVEEVDQNSCSGTLSSMVFHDAKFPEPAPGTILVLQGTEPVAPPSIDSESGAP